ncbi:MAG: DUF5615 family PIN-like protein [Planctomycetota bacterium]|nr:DUF5615 family PIN-like protein [Planctomycetota bacterium]
MARFLADENFPAAASVRLKSLGHDVLSAQEAGLANRSASDSEVLAYAQATRRAVLTQNWRHFRTLHKQHPQHAGMVLCSVDLDFDRLARSLHQALAGREDLPGLLIRVYHPPR